MISNCTECKKYNQNPKFCTFAPAYLSMWEKLESLKKYSLPIDPCDHFEPDPDMTKKEISLSLTFQQWQQLGRNSLSSKTILNFLKDKLIDHNPSLTILEWQAIANSSQDPKVLEALAEHNIEPEEEELKWIKVQSSCIDAIAFDRLSSSLTIQFNSGLVYEYLDFTSDTFQDFLHSDSKGMFFNMYIEDQYRNHFLH